MKSRWTTYLLLTAVVAVWGVVAWKIFAPASEALPAAQPKRAVPAAEAVAADTLRLDYPDPFLKGALRQVAAARSAVRALPPTKTPQPRRERVNMVHLGTIRSAGKRLHILSVGDAQYELAQGESACGFVLAKCDRDSLYLLKNGVSYGVKLCE